MDFELVIVGGGPAGVATALFLAATAPHLRDRIAVLERDTYPRDKICAGAIGARADKILATIGVRVDVPSVWIRGFSVACSRSALRLRDAHAAAPIGRVVRRIEFDRAFADEARSRGITILEGAKVVGLDLGADGARIRSTRGEIRARAVVGADGVGSFVRRALGLPRGRWSAQVVEVDTPEIPGELPRDLLHFDVADPTLHGYVWDFPTLVAGEPLMCRGVYALRLDRSPGGGPRAAEPPAAEEDIAARLTAHVARLGLPVEGLRIKRFSERGLSLHEPIARPRALLVGEAAGIDPVLGEGIAQAILYGAAAGPYLAESLASGDLSFAGWPSAMRRSRVGFDLGVRSRAAPFFYGATRRPMERLVTTSSALALAGMRYFAGERVPRRRLALAAIDAGKIAAEELISSLRSAAWW